MVFFSENGRDIFLFIEQKMKIVIPPYIKNILVCCGYDTSHVIATIGDTDIEYFVDQVRKGKVRKFFHDKINPQDVMAGCSSSIENFEFVRGHLQLLKAIVKTVRDTIEVHGVSGFSLDLPKALPAAGIKDSKTTSSKTPAASVYRKRFKFSPSTLVGGNGIDKNDDSILPLQTERSTLMQKIVRTLIVHTPNFFVQVCCVCG